ncbi:unnamed protein product [Spirodela intermedia]|uniref:WRKY domain-containing protein n=1 Tax=Spirodela intermedia TaxID=51605 RepID=A0A7I8ISA8_SPIIN|nr:unnamed protein product [Spirodela intermedia]CAA6660897.1 unnamed protein product [Spirodela intermedia]
MILARIMNDYQSLQTHLFDVVNKVDKKSPENAEADRETEEPELVSLSLGTSSWRHNKEEKAATRTRPKEDEQVNGELSLGLGTQSNSSHDNSFEDTKEEGVGELWPPSKALKTMRPGEDEVSQHIHVKKARVSVRARCDAPTMNDGCQWRKYGQKIAKGNPCPRAYYRCTIAQGCPVRKQVQRCADDMSILITTYEGIHNHPLPMSATSMASTTSAAAGMLVSGSSSSRPSIPAATMAPSSGFAGATSHGLNFGCPDDARQRQLYLPNASISSSPSHATITLDLTTPPSNSHSALTPQLGGFSSSFSSGPRFSHSSFSFSSSDPNPNQTTLWNIPFLSHGSRAKNPLGSFSVATQQPNERLYLPYTQKPPNSSPLPDGAIAAATKAITSDPGFQTALAAAITSAVGGKGTQGMAETLLKNLRWGERLSPVSNLASSPSGNGCGSSYLTRSADSNLSNPQEAEIRFNHRWASPSARAPHPLLLTTGSIAADLSILGYFLFFTYLYHFLVTRRTHGEI